MLQWNLKIFWARIRLLRASVLMGSGHIELVIAIVVVIYLGKLSNEIVEVHVSSRRTGAKQCE